MRELAVRFTYDPSAAPLTDVFIEHPDLRLESIDISVDSGIVRVDRVTGTPDALEELGSL